MFTVTSQWSAFSMIIFVIVWLFVFGIGLLSLWSYSMRYLSLLEWTKLNSSIESISNWMNQIISLGNIIGNYWYWLHLMALNLQGDHHNSLRTIINLAEIALHNVIRNAQVYSWILFPLLVHTEHIQSKIPNPIQSFSSVQIHRIRNSNPSISCYLQYIAVCVLNASCQQWIPMLCD